MIWLLGGHDQIVEMLQRTPTPTTTKTPTPSPIPTPTLKPNAEDEQGGSDVGKIILYLALAVGIVAVACRVMLLAYRHFRSS